jgi:Ca2+:H+ antiporter
MVVSISLVIPTVMSTATPPEYDDTQNTLALSRVTALVLLVLFISYLFFRFRTHGVIFSRIGRDEGARIAINHNIGDRITQHSSSWTFRLIFFCASLCAVACGWYVIHNIDASIQKMRISQSFVSMVLLPLMCNIAKSIAIVTSCRMRRIDLAVRAAMSNILDTLLFITHFLVTLGWVINKPMELEFGFFEAIVFILAILIVTYILQHGKTTYFEGVMLIGA